MTNEQNIEQNIERSGRIDVSGRTYYGVNWLQLLRKTNFLVKGPAAEAMDAKQP
jgi:hypothetical protein